MTEQMNKTKLLNEMHNGYTAFENLLAPLSETQMTTAGVNGEWSIKDILAHLAAWQKRQRHAQGDLGGGRNHGNAQRQFDRGPFGGGKLKHR